MKVTHAALVAGALSALALASTAGRADVLPPGAKGVKNSVAIEGKLPPGKALLVANTFYGATRTLPGGSVEVAWHPLSGPMRLFLVDAAVAAKVPAVGNVDHAKELKEAAETGVACSDEFSGTRTIPETEPADEIRLVFQVEATATACKAKVIRTEYYAKDGKPVAGLDGGPAPKSSSAGNPPASASPSAAPEAASSASPSTPNTTPRAGCASCSVASVPSSSQGPLLGLALAAALAVRKKTRARRSQS